MREWRAGTGDRTPKTGQAGRARQEERQAGGEGRGQGQGRSLLQ